MLRTFITFMMLTTSLMAANMPEKSWWFHHKLNAKHMLVADVPGYEDVPLNKKFSDLYDAAASVAADKNGIVQVASHSGIPNGVMVKIRMNSIDISNKGWEWRWFICDKDKWINVSASEFQTPGYNDSIMAFGINPKWKIESGSIAYNYPFDRFAENGGPLYEKQPVWDTKCSWQQKKVDSVDVSVLESLPAGAKNIVFANGNIFWQECKQIKRMIRVKVAE